jgi:hypothetical protein
MQRLWQFLLAKSNRAILSWIGSGLVVVTTGLWAVATHFWKDKPIGPDPHPNICAAGSVIAGGNIGNSTITNTSNGAASVDCPVPPLSRAGSTPKRE